MAARFIGRWARVAAFAVGAAFILFGSVSDAAQNAAYPDFVGAYGYSYQPGGSGGTITLTAQQLRNPSATRTTGALRLELWAFPTPYASGITGYRLARYDLSGTLGPGQSFDNLSVTTSVLSTPQPGSYYVTLFVYEHYNSGCTSSDAYCVDNHDDFPEKLTSGVAGSQTAGAVVHAAALFSSAQPASQSFLRFYNTGASAGTATVALTDYATGQSLGQWTSPSIPAGAEQQFAISSIESAVSATPKPAYYSIAVTSTISGYFQHVLWRSADGTLTNLSTCAGDVTTDAAKIAGVHSSLLTAYPSSIVVNNTGPAAAAVALGIYDARDGAKIGTYTTSSIPADGQAILSVTAVEAGLGKAPAAGMYHYVVKAESANFTGFLQHLVNNVQVGVTTDMTTSCNLSGAASATGVSPLRVGAVFSSAQTASQSFLRLYNTSSSGGTATVTVKDSGSGALLGQWTSPSVAPGTEQQFYIGTIESAVSGRPAYYSISVESKFAGYFQHVLWRSADGTLTNLSTCDTGVTADTTRLSGVHSSLLAAYPSSVVVANTGATALSVALGIYDAATGDKLGTYTTPSIASAGNAVIPVTAIEAGIGTIPTGSRYHYVVKVETAGFSGFLQHLVNNTQAGVVTDMTTECTLAAAASPAEGTTYTFIYFKRNGSAAPGTATLTIPTGSSKGTFVIDGKTMTNVGFSFGAYSCLTGANLAGTSYSCAAPENDPHTMMLCSQDGLMQYVLFRADDPDRTTATTAEWLSPENHNLGINVYSSCGISFNTQWNRVYPDMTYYNWPTLLVYYPESYVLGLLAGMPLYKARTATVLNEHGFVAVRVGTNLLEVWH